MRSSDWSSDGCSSDLALRVPPLGHAFATGIGQQPVMRIGRHRPAEQSLQQPVQMGGRQQILATADERDALQGIVMGDAEVIARRGFLARQHDVAKAGGQQRGRSEEHTSELQSLMRISYAVFCLKKKKTSKNSDNTMT